MWIDTETARRARSYQPGGVPGVFHQSISKWLGLPPLSMAVRSTWIKVAIASRLAHAWSTKVRSSLPVGEHPSDLPALGRVQEAVVALLLVAVRFPCRPCGFEHCQGSLDLILKILNVRFRDRVAVHLRHQGVYPL
jgi:hypothetical protein